MPNAIVDAFCHGPRLGRAPSSHARTIGAQPVACTATSRGIVAPSQPRPAHLQQGLVDADEPDAAAGGVEDDVGHPPAELLDDLEPMVFLPSSRYGSLSVETSV